MKRKLLAVLMSACLAASSLACVARADGQKVVTLGADMTAEQKQAVLRYFGIEGQNLKTLVITNQDERDHLGSYVPIEQIGTRTYSCALVNPTASGGIQVKTANLSWVTSNMIATTLSTSGVVNCEVIAAAPFEVSGTGALTGILMAYESAVGKKLDPVKKEVATQELVTTATVANTIGQQQATTIVNETKIQVIKGNVVNTNEIADIVEDVAMEEQIELSEENKMLITDLLAKIAEQQYEYEEMKDTLERVENNLENQNAENTQNAQNSADVNVNVNIQNGGTSTPAETEAETLAEDSILTNTDDSALGNSVIVDATNEEALPDETQTEALPDSGSTSGQEFLLPGPDGQQPQEQQVQSESGSGSGIQIPDSDFEIFTPQGESEPDPNGIVIQGPDQQTQSESAADGSGNDTGIPDSDFEVFPAPDGGSDGQGNTGLDQSQDNAVLDQSQDNAVLDQSQGGTVLDQPQSDGTTIGDDGYDPFLDGTDFGDGSDDTIFSGDNGVVPDGENTEIPGESLTEEGLMDGEAMPMPILISDLSFVPDAYDLPAGSTELSICFANADYVPGTGELTVYRESDDSVFDTVSMSDIENVALEPITDPALLNELDWDSGYRLVVALNMPLEQNESYYVTLSEDVLTTADAMSSSEALSDNMGWTFGTVAEGLVLDNMDPFLKAGSMVSGTILMDAEYGEVSASVTNVDPSVATFDVTEFTADMPGFNLTLVSPGTTTFQITYYDVDGMELTTVDYTLTVR